MRHYCTCNYQNSFKCGLESAAGIIFTHHCTFSNPAIFRNYFVIKLHFQTKLNQNALH